MTELELKCIGLASGFGAGRMTDEVWDTCEDMLKRGLLTEVKRGACTHLVPTPEALVLAMETRDKAKKDARKRRTAARLAKKQAIRERHADAHAEQSGDKS